MNSWQHEREESKGRFRMAGFKQRGAWMTRKENVKGGWVNFSEDMEFSWVAREIFGRE